MANDDPQSYSRSFITHRDWLGHAVQLAIIVGGILTAWITLNSSVVSVNQQMADFRAQVSQQLSEVKDQVHTLQTMQSSIASLTTNVATLGAREERTERDVADLRATTIGTDNALRDINNKLGVMGEQIRQMTAPDGARPHR